MQCYKVRTEFNYGGCIFRASISFIRGNKTEVPSIPAALTKLKVNNYCS